MALAAEEEASLQHWTMADIEGAAKQACNNEADEMHVVAATVVDCNLHQGGLMKCDSSEESSQSAVGPAYCGMI
jgi:hypothetical protein